MLWSPRFPSNPRPANESECGGHARCAGVVIAAAAGRALTSRRPTRSRPIRRRRRAARRRPMPSANPMAVPGFWDPRRRPERPDLSRISIIRFLTETDYPPFNYAGPDGAPAGFNVDLARLICEEIKVACTVQMRRFDTLIASLEQQQGRRGDRLDRRDAGDAQAGRFQRSLLPHAGALRVAPRLQHRRRAAAGAGRPQDRGGRRHRARSLSEDAVHRSRAASLSERGSRARRAEARARSICCSATASRSPSGSTAPTPAAAANSAAGPIWKAATSARASASRSSAATTCCGRRSTGRCSGCGRRAASPTCGCAISRSARFEPRI